MTVYVPGDPVGKERARHDPRRPNERPRTPAKTRSYEEKIGWAWKQANGPKYDGPVEISITVFLQVPKSYSKNTRAAMLYGDILPTRTPDISNVLKAAEDGLNKIAYKDDSQIAFIKECGRYYAEEPGLLVRVEPANMAYAVADLYASLKLRDHLKRTTNTGGITK